MGVTYPARASAVVLVAVTAIGYSKSQKRLLAVSSWPEQEEPHSDDGQHNCPRRRLAALAGVINEGDIGIHQR